MAIGVLGQDGRWVPDSAFTSELNNDPAAVGYKNADGTWKSAHEIGVLLTQPGALIPNPVAQPSIPKPFTYLDIFNLLSSASLANLRTLPELPRALDDINAMNRQAVATWFNLLLQAPAGGTAPITQAEHDNIVALMNATELDPSWPAQVHDVSRVEKVFSVGSVPLALITAVTGVA